MLRDGVHIMSPNLVRFGLMVALMLVAGRPVIAQRGGADVSEDRVKPTGAAAKKADDLIRSYTARIEKEIDQGRKEAARLRAELHELIDVRQEMIDAIAELRGDLASKGAYSAEGPFYGQAPTQDKKTAPQPGQGMVMPFRRDLFYGLGSALPKDPSPEQREQIRRLAPQADLKRTIERLRLDVDETRTEIDQLAYTLLELRVGIPSSVQIYGGMGGVAVPWFGSIEMQGQGGMGGGMGGGMRGGMM